MNRQEEGGLVNVIMEEERLNHGLVEKRMVKKWQSSKSKGE